MAAGGAGRDMTQAIGRIAIVGAAAMATLAVAAPAFAACNKTITVAEQVQMAFGTIAPASAGGNVTLAPTGGESAGFGFVLLGGSTPATFKVTGTNNCAVNISFAAGSLLGPGAPMTVNNFTTNAGPNPTLDPAGGQLSFSVGATLVVNSGQGAGPYAGSYSITVTY
jgi:hypothetical protein